MLPALMLACLLVPVAWTDSVWAEDASSPPATQGKSAVAADTASRPATRDELQDKLNKLTARRQQLEGIVATRASSSTNGPDDAVRNELELVKFHASLCIQHLEELSLAEELRSSLAEAQQQQHDLQLAGPEETPPYSILFWDDLCDQCDAEETNQQSLAAELNVAKDMQQNAARMRENADKKRRELKEACENADDAQKRQTISAQLDLATRNGEAIAALVQLRRAEVANREIERQISQVRSEYLVAKRSAVEPNVVFDREHLEEVRQALSRIESEKQQQIPELQAKLKELDDLESKTQASLDTQPRTVQEQAAEGWQRARQGLKHQLSMVQQRLREIVVMRAQWDVRFKVHNRLATPDQLANWVKETRQYHERVTANRELLEEEARALMLEWGREEKQALLHRKANESHAVESHAVTWHEFQLACMRELSQAYSANLVQLEAMENMLSRLLHMLSARTEISASANWLNWARQAAAATWQYEITSVDDRPITVRKVAISIVLLVLGVFLSRRLSRLVGKRLLPHTGMNQGAAAAVQTISFYALVVCCGFISLELVHIPLTVFTFLGGAIAIGVGFGSQNILNNFFSGLILLAEQPVRVGDLVDIDGLSGIVEKIGTRSTRVRTGSNVEIIIPNSKFLENNVTNWTLTDTRMRLSVRVGVAYGSSPTEVQQILQRAVTGCDAIMPSPAPFVIFSDFGDNALMFEVYFWTDVRTMTQARIIESNVRLAIDRFLTDNQIVVAFPQRDIHLDTARPLEVRMLPAVEDEAMRLYRNAS
jgi:small-conductance mechanosensitive channel